MGVPFTFLHIPRSISRPPMQSICDTNGVYWCVLDNPQAQSTQGTHPVTPVTHITIKGAYATYITLTKLNKTKRAMYNSFNPDDTLVRSYALAYNRAGVRAYSLCFHLRYLRTPGGCTTLSKSCMEVFGQMRKMMFRTSPFALSMDPFPAKRAEQITSRQQRHG